MNCGVCVKYISRKQYKLVCIDCLSETDASCPKFSKVDMTADGLVWECKDGAGNRRKSMQFDLEAGEGNSALEYIVSMVIL